jgi:16S rRNA (adenine1518-N6/adenine1519-N6)-dimethyltransferase
MNISETKRLLRERRIVPNRLLGQNFMIETSFFPKLGDYASLGKKDVVLDAGAGLGFLTRFLANNCKAVIAVEKDPQITDVLREQLRGVANVTIIKGDVLEAALPEFNKVVSIPPYYLSSRLVTWLFERKVECTVLILQREFAGRLVATVDSGNYGWLAVVACHSMKVEILDAVPKLLFYPPPDVDSVIARLTPWKTVPFEIKEAEFFKRMVRWLFTQRNKKLSNALPPFIKSTLKLTKDDAKNLANNFTFSERRVRQLLPEDFGVLANALVS